MIVCPKCGEKLEDAAVFCTNCGEMLNNISSQKSKNQEIHNVKTDPRRLGKRGKAILVTALIIATVAAIIFGVIYAKGNVDQSQFVGTYYPSSAKRGTEEMSPDSVLGEGFSVVLLEGEEAIFNLPGSTTEGRWKVNRTGEFSFTGSSMTIKGTLKDRLLTLQLNGIELLLTWTSEIKVPETETTSETESEIQTEPASESETETQRTDGAALFEGDWYGITQFVNCTGDYAGNDGLEAETIARLVFDEDGNCSPYIAMALGEKSRAMNFRNIVMVWDAATDTMSVAGNCLKGSISGGTRAYINGIGALEFETDIVESGSRVTLKVYLRRLGDNWKIDDTLSPNAEQLEYYEGLNLETIASLFGMDITELPKEGYKAPDLINDGDAMTASYGGWDESYFGVGVASVATMEKTWEWISEMSAEDRNNLTYQDIVDKVGSKGRGGATADTDPAYLHVVWYTDKNKGPMRMKFKPSQDGTLYYVDCTIDNSIYEEE